ncbi:hypothetical protein BGY98DRAFT_1107803 [Russula aff. rugulosa BPL654]|nr:hypothetical protein BGY98DRAFT_1107803 [Russula aff. rugulosa BPL654]
MSSNVQLDPFVAQAQNDNVAPLQKIKDLNKIIQMTETGMLTTRTSDGHLHSRAMTPACPMTEESEPPNALINLVFITNNSTPKCQEIQNDNHVNLSFFHTFSKHWASISGVARVTEDRSVIKKYWSPSIGSYFGDLGDGIHKGDENDPRVSVIEVVPDEIRYWVASSPNLPVSVQEVASTVQGKVTVPGELRTITSEEIQLAQGIGAKTK